jgi:multidrug efflux pump subunit AcrA (membrane-fusion protein)
MSDAAADPYAVLGVASDVSDLELRRVYRNLVKRHHPDHNGGSPESAHRFAQIQSAYAAIVQRRRGPHGGGSDAPRSGASDRSRSADGALQDRLAKLEREMAAAREAELRRAQEQARQAREEAAKLAAAARMPPGPAHRVRPTPEELGQYSTDDSFTKIIDDAAEQLGERLRRSEAKKQFARRLTDLFGRDS